MSAISSSQFFADLQKMINLPKGVSEMTIKLAVNQIVEIDCKFHATEIDVTNLSSHAMTHVMGHSVEQKRYWLTDTKPGEGDFALS